MTGDNTINRRNALKSAGGALAAGSGLVVATSDAEADCPSACGSGERCAYASTLYDGCGGSDTGWSLANWTCVTIIDECQPGIWPWDPKWVRIEDCTGPDADECWIKKSTLTECSRCS